MFGVKYATLCLLITYHWHGSWAVSVWPSGRDGIATEVNGSPTDARLSIPVVKRSSNQADLANELPRRFAVIVGDSREHVGEFHARGSLEMAHREYPNENVKKASEPMIHKQETRKIMIEGSLDERDETNSARKPEKWKNMKVEREEGRKKLDFGIESSIPRKDVNTVIRLIGGVDPSTVKGPRSRWPNVATSSGRWPDHDLASESTSRRRERRDVKIHPVNSARLEETTNAREKSVSRVQSNDGETRWNSVQLGDGTGTFVVGGGRARDLSMLSRGRRETSLVNNSRIDNDTSGAGKERANHKKTENHELKSGLSNGSSSLSESKFTKHARMLNEGGETSDASSGIASSVDVNKVRDTGRLHQQSRNTKPRTIIRHLRGIIKRQIGPYGDESKLTRFHAERRHYGRIASTDPRKRRQLANQKIANFSKFNGNSQQLRFIPSYNNYGRNPKYFSSQASRDGIGNELVPLASNGDLTSGNFRKLPKFEARQFDQLRKSLSGVFDRQSSIGEKEELPNVKMILPKQIFVASPRLIYDTKILPAPFSFPSYYQNSDDNNHDENNREKMSPSALPISGVFDQREMKGNLERPGIATSENSQESVTSLRNFVTPLPPYRGEVSLPVNEEASMPLDSTFTDEIYQVREIEQENEMRNPTESTGIHEQGTFQGDENETRPNEKSTGGARTSDHSGDARSSYENSLGTYANHAENERGNVDHSTVIETIDDEYLNHQTTRYGEVANIETDTRMSHIPARSPDDSDDRGRYKWRGKYDDDNARYAAKYSFGYRVSDDETQNHFGHQETRDEGITRGRYHVRLPDGRTQKVNYHVDDKGYHAVVSYHLDNVQ